VAPFQGFASTDLRTQGGDALSLGWYVDALSGLKPSRSGIPFPAIREKNCRGIRQELVALEKHVQHDVDVQ
jgi:hypothetical protein